MIIIFSLEINKELPTLERQDCTIKMTACDFLIADITDDCQRLDSQICRPPFFPNHYAHAHTMMVCACACMHVVRSYNIRLNSKKKFHRPVPCQVERSRFLIFDHFTTIRIIRINYNTGIYDRRNPHGNRGTISCMSYLVCFQAAVRLLEEQNIDSNF